MFHIVLSSGSTEEVHIGCGARVADLQKAYKAHGGRFLRLVTQDGRLLDPRQGSTGSTVGFLNGSLMLDSFRFRETHEGDMIKTG